jgi:predicted transcriptional regulator
MKSFSIIISIFVVDNYDAKLMTQVYNLFRQLGLRHLFVVPRPSRVLGLITRKDLLIEVIFQSNY